MKEKIADIFINVQGMTCSNCENRIETALGKTTGIFDVKASYASGRVAVTYDEQAIRQETIESIIESMDYTIARKPVRARGDMTASPATPGSRAIRIFATGIALAVLYIVLRQISGLPVFNAFPQAEQGMGYGLLFGIGLLTSVHCIAMCWGISLSQCVPQPQPAGSASAASSLRPSFLYNAGRVISYTVIGGIVGAIGSVVSFSGWARGLVAVIAGIFMVIMGLNMLNLFPGLRKLNLRLPRVFARRIYKERQSGAGKPLIVGLLNGLMPCGPLQAMQLYALSTGSPVEGALSMFLFSLGTVPLMFGLGALSTLLSRRFTKRMLQASAVLVVILGVFMFQNGLGLSGFSLPQLAGGNTAGTSASTAPLSANIVDGVQLVTSGLPGGQYEAITVLAGVPVKWTIVAPSGSITGCNNRLIIPAYGIEKPLVTGDNVIEFTPDKSGIVPYSCWMGMIRSKITVVDAVP